MRCPQHKQIVMTKLLPPRDIFLLKYQEIIEFDYETVDGAKMATGFVQVGKLSIESIAVQFTLLPNRAHTLCQWAACILLVFTVINC